MADRRTPWAVITARCSSFAWSVSGRWSLSRGRLPQAVTAFEHAVTRRPGAFRPLLRLAHGYLLSKDSWRAHRTLAQARESNPVRFARVVPRWLEREGVRGETLHRLLGTTGTFGHAKEWGSKVPSTVTTAGAGRRRHQRVAPANLPFGDCLDLDEYARFRAMPPISKGEMDGIDWDGLFEDLLDE